MTSPENGSPPAGEVPTSMKEALLSVAEDIERLGHYKPSADPSTFPPEQDRLWDPTVRPNGKCCLLINPTRERLNVAGKYDLSYDLVEEMERRVRNKTGQYLTLAGYSDHAPTDQVLAMLRG